MNFVRKNIKEVVTIFCASFLFFMCFVSFEPVLVGAVSDSVTVSQSVTSEITISAPTDVTMSPSIAGMTGGTGNGSATWTVVTNDTSGFNLALKASTTPALQAGSYSFANYTEAGAVPDYTWSVASSDSEFGYTVEPATAADTVSSFLDDGSDCGTGALNTSDKCWDGFTTSDVIVVNRSSITASSGEAEVVKFRAQSGASHFQEEGTYTAIITATALTN